MKTNVVIKVKHDGKEECCRVKLDADKFPYIVIDNEKVVLNSAQFPRTAKVLYGLMELHMEMVSGQEELELILNNPDLTCDKLTLKQQMRLG